MLLFIPSVSFASGLPKADDNKYFSVSHNGNWSTWNIISPIWDSNRDFIDQKSGVNLVRGKLAWWGINKTIYLYKDFGDYEFQKTIDISQSMKDHPEAWQEIARLYSDRANAIKSSKTNFVQHDWDIASGAADTIVIQYNNAQSESSSASNLSSNSSSSIVPPSSDSSENHAPNNGDIIVSAPATAIVGQPYEFSVKVNQSNNPDAAITIFSFFTHQDFTSKTASYTKEQTCAAAFDTINRDNTTCQFCHFQQFTCPTGGTCDHTFADATGFFNTGQSRIVAIGFVGNNISEEGCINDSFTNSSSIVDVSADGTTVASSSTPEENGTGAATTDTAANNSPDFGTPIEPSTLSAFAGTIPSIQQAINWLTGNFLSTIIGGLAVISLMVGGILMITSGGDEKKYTAGTQTVLYSIIGIVVILAANIIPPAINNTIKDIFT